MAVDLAMLSEVHFIIIAEAGVKAKVESVAAAINILISNLARKGNQRSAGYSIGIRIFPRSRFRNTTFLCAAVQREGAWNQRFGRSAMLPVAISASQCALP